MTLSVLLSSTMEAECGSENNEVIIIPLLFMLLVIYLQGYTGTVIDMLLLFCKLGTVTV